MAPAPVADPRPRDVTQKRHLLTTTRSRMSEVAGRVLSRRSIHIEVIEPCRPRHSAGLKPSLDIDIVL